MPFLLIDKPAGKTSHDVVAYIRRITGEKRVGHSGTLDPFATGLLIIGVGRSCTKQLGYFLGLDKTYVADIALGATTETLDPESPERSVPKHGGGETITLEELRKALCKLTGPQEQIPPMHSAIKVKGKKLYELARQGKTVPVEPRNIIVYQWKPLFEPNPLSLPSPSLPSLPSFPSLPSIPTLPREIPALPSVLPSPFPLPITLSFQITVSSGTYIRALARDLGKLCGTGGYLRYLRRTAIGPHKRENAVPLNKLTKENSEFKNSMHHL